MAFVNSACAPSGRHRRRARRHGDAVHGFNFANVSTMACRFAPLAGGNRTEAVLSRATFHSPTLVSCVAPPAPTSARAAGARRRPPQAPPPASATARRARTVCRGRRLRHARSGGDADAYIPAAATAPRPPSALPLRHGRRRMAASVWADELTAVLPTSWATSSTRSRWGPAAVVHQQRPPLHPLVGRRPSAAPAGPVDGNTSVFLRGRGLRARFGGRPPRAARRADRRRDAPERRAARACAARRERPRGASASPCRSTPPAPPGGRLTLETARDWTQPVRFAYYDPQVSALRPPRGATHAPDFTVEASGLPLAARPLRLRAAAAAGRHRRLRPRAAARPLRAAAARRRRRRLPTAGVACFS